MHPKGLLRTAVISSMLLGLVATGTFATTKSGKSDKSDKSDKSNKSVKSAKSRDGVTARARIRGCSTDSRIRGWARLTEVPSEEGVKTVKVAMLVRGLSDGDHAVHLHQTAKCDPCGAAGGHFDPGPNTNPSPDGNHPFHMGDLINIESNGGRARLKTITTRVTLSDGPLSLNDADGSAFIIHDLEDTYCPDGEEAMCAGGSRAACGIIEVIP